MWSKADESKVGSMATLARCWAEELQRSMARVQSGNHCYYCYKDGINWWEKKNSQRKTSMTLNQTICRSLNVLHIGKQGVHSVGVAVLAPVFKKLPTELKLKSNTKLLKYKNIVHIATFSIRTLHRISQLDELTASAAEHNTDIVFNTRTGILT